jgi:hypothetical protein
MLSTATTAVLFTIAKRWRNTNDRPPIEVWHRLLPGKEGNAVRTELQQGSTSSEESQTHRTNMADSTCVSHSEQAEHRGRQVGREMERQLLVTGFLWEPMKKTWN